MEKHRIEHFNPYLGWILCPMNWGDACVRFRPMRHREVIIKENGEKEVILEVNNAMEITP